MKILLIAVGIDNKYGKGLQEVNKRRIITPMLGLPYLAACTPSDIEIKIINETHGLITEYETTDIVCISGMTMHTNS
ncbi:MAG: hypothetical protein H7Y18_12235 [Clostridiaceae bacterium]|nr:hypothetical protein [Clostridiaceae bacterium]